MTSSDGVPPELAVLGIRELPACTGQTGPPRVFAVLIALTIVVRSSAFECVGTILCQQASAMSGGWAMASVNNSTSSD